MGFFSNLFSNLFGGGGKKAEEADDANAQALKQFFKENLPGEVVEDDKIVPRAVHFGKLQGASLLSWGFKILANYIIKVYRKNWHCKSCSLRKTM